MACYASGLFTRFDVTFLVCEPTVRSVGVYHQYLGYAAEFGVRVVVVGNKVCDEDDVRAAERGEVRPIGDLEPGNRAALQLMREVVDATAKDWHTYQRQAVEFHLRNAAAWASAQTGEDLAAQVDPDFVPGEHAMPSSGHHSGVAPARAG